MDDSTADHDYDPHKDRETSSDTDTDCEPQEGTNDVSPPREDESDENVDEVIRNNETGFENSVDRSTARSHKRTNKILTRKRQRDPSTWKRTV